MTIIDIEKLRSEISSFLPRISGHPKILILFSFYDKLLASNDPNLIDAFSLEFIDEYLGELVYYSANYSEPKKTEQLLNQLAELKLMPILENYLNKFEELIQSINEKLNNLLAALELNTLQTEEKTKLLFPLLGKIVTSSETFTYASIEPVTIKVTTSKAKDTFVFIPSRQKKEHLEEQAEISFQLALQYLKSYKSIFHKHHEVLIYFDNINAEYDGCSLGIVLTIGFIEQLSKLYNLPYITTVKNQIALTGEIDKSGNLLSVGEKNITNKVEPIFYSNINTFVIPKSDELLAINKLKDLNGKYPKRQLNVVAVENLTDLLYRRNLVDIKKQSPVDRTVRYIRKNWKSLSFVCVLLAVLTFNFWIDLDTNPAQFHWEKNVVYVKNKMGKILWTKKQGDGLITSYLPDDGSRNFRKLVDIDCDGTNEVIFCGLIPDSSTNQFASFNIHCYDSKGLPIWNFSLHDTVFSEREFLTPPYWCSLIDTTTINKEKVLIGFANNLESYASAIFMLDLRSGKRLDGTLWGCGHFISSFVKDLTNDGNKELIFTGIDNGNEKAYLGIIELNNFLGVHVLPSTPQYMIRNYPLAKLKAFILFPNSDLLKYLKLRNSFLFSNGLVDYPLQKKIGVAVFQDRDTAAYKVDFDYNFKNLDIYVWDLFRLKRDSLVVNGKLNYPLTDTKEYREILKSQILSWDGKKFVKWVDNFENKRTNSEILSK